MADDIDDNASDNLGDFSIAVNDGINERAISVCFNESGNERKGKEMLYLTTHSTHFIYGYIASDIC